MKRSQKIMHFLYSLKKSWLFLAGLILLTFILCILSLKITDSSCDFSKNIFSVLVSLLCGIIVALSTSIIDIYQKSVLSYKRIIEIVSDAIQLIESRYVNEEHSIKVYITLHFEYALIYRELCFCSEPLAYDKDFKLISDKFKSMVDYLCSINEESTIDNIREKLKKHVEDIRSNL